MSVLMILRVPGDPAKLEEFAGSNSELMQKIVAHARARGALHHGFFGGENEVLVVDKWETEDGFREFFDSEEDVPKIMQQVATGEPEISFYRPLDTGDDF